MVAKLIKKSNGYENEYAVCTCKLFRAKICAILSIPELKFEADIYPQLVLWGTVPSPCLLREWPQTSKWEFSPATVAGASPGATECKAEGSRGRWQSVILPAK